MALPPSLRHQDLKKWRMARCGWRGQAFEILFSVLGCQSSQDSTSCFGSRFIMSMQREHERERKTNSTIYISVCCLFLRQSHSERSFPFSPYFPCYNCWYFNAAKKIEHGEKVPADKASKCDARKAKGNKQPVKHEHRKEAKRYPGKV